VTAPRDANGPGDTATFAGGGSWGSGLTVPCLRRLARDFGPMAERRVSLVLWASKDSTILTLRTMTARAYMRVFFVRPNRRHQPRRMPPVDGSANEA